MCFHQDLTVSVLNFVSDTHTNAFSRSATRSLASSRPTDKRIKLSATPAALLFSEGMDLWVIWAGWQSRLFTPPRLSASLKYCVEVTKAIAASSVSFFNV